MQSYDPDLVRAAFAHLTAGRKRKPADDPAVEAFLAELEANPPLERDAALGSRPAADVLDPPSDFTDPRSVNPEKSEPGPNA